MGACRERYSKLVCVLPAETNLARMHTSYICVVRVYGNGSRTEHGFQRRGSTHTNKWEHKYEAERTTLVIYGGP